ncbi:arf-GAP with dual PH domain-containing protein 1-like [Protopterus annectens]|uniref:arf-GAP with dual PH domain-containing protein 1-like n=1 Tax=Protopterus annectens TaxID=7888 RepID=UPI001CFA7E76|nr:arf-GAP with dual PH domain-containing protein 1-like [Protopterus annectens]
MAGEKIRNQKALKEMIKKDGNNICADCQAPDPDWASHTLGTFICLNCSGIHRNIPEISKVKSTVMDHWDDSQVEFMAEHGNQKVNAKYEAFIPVYYYRPTFQDCQVLREQWVRSKYERKEFVAERDNKSEFNGIKEGYFWKRGRDNGQFLSRRFVLSEQNGTLMYYAKHDAKEPKAVIKVENLNASFQPAKIGNPNGLQITYVKDNKTRNIFLYHENGKEIVEWFNALREAQYNYLKVAFPCAPNTEILPKLTRSFIKEGYMEKTGPRQTEGFKKRWFTMDHRRLMYFKDPLDAFAKGEVFIGSKDHGYNVILGLPPGTQGNFSWQFGITIVTPERNFLFTCETDSDQAEWYSAFNKVVKQTMTPQDCAQQAYFKHKP